MNPQPSPGRDDSHSGAPPERRVLRQGKYVLLTAVKVLLVGGFLLLGNITLQWPLQLLLVLVVLLLWRPVVRAEQKIALQPAATEFEGNRRRFEETVARGAPFVLYLRSFWTEQPRAPASPLDISNEQNAGSRVEQAVVKLAGAIPVFGFANPHDHAAARGILRMLEDDDDFPEQLRRAMSAARLIVIYVDAETPGVMKEVDLASSSAEIAIKTIVVGDNGVLVEDPARALRLVTGPVTGLRPQEWATEFERSFLAMLGSKPRWLRTRRGQLWLLAGSTSALLLILGSVFVISRSGDATVQVIAPPDSDVVVYVDDRAGVKVHKNHVGGVKLGRGEHRVRVRSDSGEAAHFIEIRHGGQHWVVPASAGQCFVSVAHLVPAFTTELHRARIVERHGSQPLEFSGQTTLEHVSRPSSGTRDQEVTVIYQVDCAALGRSSHELEREIQRRSANELSLGAGEPP